jgi:TonB family protein
MYAGPWFRVFVLLALASIVSPAPARASDVEQRLRQEYRGKKFVLRNFYVGKHLRYDPSGNLIGPSISGDWIGDGLVLVQDIHFSHRDLIVEANRLLVVELNGGQFQILPEPESQLPKLRIESSLQEESQADAVLAKIFLTSQDSLADVVDDYWKPCIREAAGAAGGQPAFSSDLLTVPSIGAESRGSKDGATGKTELDCKAKPAHRKGDSVPHVIHQTEPEYSQAARSAHYQGVVVLKLVVDEKGAPRYIRVINSIGNGLDRQAIKAVRQWVFAPAEKDGRPIPTEIAVEVDFRLYR